jgi:hypothetical protein
MLITETLTSHQLLQLHSQILDELTKRGVVKTKNNPIGDYAEWLVATSLGCVLQTNSTAGYDAIDKEGYRLQIKARRITVSNKSRQLSAIRNLDGNGFDYLVAVIFDEGYGVKMALKIPHQIIKDYAKYSEHINGHILHLRGSMLSDLRIEDITCRLVCNESVGFS